MTTPQESELEKELNKKLVSDIVGVLWDVRAQQIMPFDAGLLIGELMNKYGVSATRLSSKGE